jgi:hypothetical protein
MTGIVMYNTMKLGRSMEPDPRLVVKGREVGLIVEVFAVMDGPLIILLGEQVFDILRTRGSQDLTIDNFT